MSENYVEVTIPVTVDCDELLGLLQDSEALGAWEGDGVSHLCWSERRWNPLVLGELKKTLVRLGRGDCVSGVAVHYLPDQDWNARWVMSVEPIRIGRRFRIRQSWNLPDTSFEGIELVIDPKRAFGTGYHATTQLVLEWIEQHVRPGERILDVGTGTGILAMAALRLGAGTVLGIDNDPVAIECACENAAQNGFGPELALKTTSLAELDETAFDTILANLDRNTVLRHCTRFRQILSTGGRICVSGIQIDDFAEVAAAVEAAGGLISERQSRDEWVALEAHF